MSTQIAPLEIPTSGTVFRNLSTPELVEQSIVRGEGQLASNGALLVTTGERTGRSPNDRFVVDSPQVHDEIWWGKVNVPISEAHFDTLYKKVLAQMATGDQFVFDGFAGADPEYRLPVRVITAKAWHSLFARTLFVRPSAAELKSHHAEFTVINAGEMLANPQTDGTNSGVFVILSLERKTVIIGGTQYGGEIKKSIFAVMNYLLPKRGVFPMHCSANIGQDGDAALFFGLSGTGKTTLSADPNRRLIGDDEHGWSDRGVFNFEGGCYAKVIQLSEEAEPQIYRAIKFGSIVENVVVNAAREPDYDDGSITENTRTTYPVEHIDNCVIPGIGGHPDNVMFLTADAFGVLPPIAKLSKAQAMFHFISGYTAKLAGTEAGVTEPTATFSACFGSPFLPLHPTRYATMLGQQMDKHDADVWLVNTGWSGGPYGVGKRMSIQYTRALITAALSGDLAKVDYETDPVFGLSVPKSCQGVPSEILMPRNTWADKAAYDAKAKHLAELFVKNFEAYRSEASADVIAAAPKV
ncbi:MAG: phosphoenolpyruvate carboxykinase [ATP] 2 [Gemmatimonadota bacterium]|nr:MAG: phosphoenolpyruvate carboxykinase [ATP] 2 [Gemmatimonadota bacterium]